MTIKNTFTALAALLLMTACNNSPKALVLYYSQTGTTKAVAEEIQAQTGADICSFDVVQVYDGTFDETVQRCLQEREAGFVPDLTPLECDLSKYDVIYLGYPIWFGTYAPPVKALLQNVNLEGKVIVPFCTFGSGGLQSSSADLKEALPNSDVREGYGVRTARVEAAAAELDRFLIENGWKDGSMEPLPEFSDPADVTEAEAGIFSAACSGYQYPLGTPVSVCSRAIPGGTEYLFVSKMVRFDGTEGESRIFVTAADGKEPEFTQVIR